MIWTRPTIGRAKVMGAVSGFPGNEQWMDRVMLSEAKQHNHMNANSAAACYLLSSEAVQLSYEATASMRTFQNIVHSFVLGCSFSHSGCW